MLSNKLFSSIGNTDRLYVDDVFSAYTYTGNESTQTITNGIDLAGKGGMVWLKGRSTAYHHVLVDTVRGTGAGYLRSNTTGAQSNPGYGVSTFNNNGFTLTDDALVNQASATQVAWTFRKAPKFFDVVTYTGNGASNRALSHQLNADVGMVMVKATSTTGDWWVFHRSATGDLVLNTTATQTGSKANIPSATSSTFTVNGSANTNGASYVAYLFAHDVTADGIIQCGSFTGGSTVTLGWEPQFLLLKGVSLATDWYMHDNMRGMPVGANDPYIFANTSTAENYATSFVDPNATGFSTTSNWGVINGIYLAIRRPNKPPTTGTQVYNAVARTGTGSGSVEVTGAGFAPDMVVGMGRGSTFGTAWYDRLRGKELALRSALTNAEYNASPGGEGTLSMDGVKVESSSGILNSAGTYINWFFKRAPGFFDVVCIQSTPSADLSFSHDLGVVPELIIHKDRGAATDWDVWTTAFGGKHYLKLNSTSAATSVSQPSTLTATTVFSGGGSQTGNSPQVCYLFASLPGISKVGRYTGNGSSQTINCGFSTGARFILIKRTDSTGDWYVWDTARGIIAANDPHLSLNTTAAEVTTNDSVDPDSTGFIVNQVAATNINVNGATYIFLSIA